jgi:iron complex outermembrane receptor protein
MKKLAGLSALIVGTISTNAYAQSSDNDQSVLREIIVTAQKRSENLQNVPIAISAITADDLESKGVGGVLELRQAVPNLNFGNANGALQASLRGIGSSAIQPGFENSFAIYIDDVYIGSQNHSFLNLSNIAQVAVLKGPQGTLFGRNATAGVMQVTTRTPTTEPIVEGTLSYGNYQTISGTAYMSGAIAPNLNADFTFYGKHQGEGFGENLVNGKDPYRIKHDIAARSKWVWTPSDDTKLTLIGDYSDFYNTLNAVTLLPGTVSGYAPAQGPAPDRGYDIAVNTRNLRKGWNAGGSLRLDQNLGDVSLVSITAYRESETSIVFDFDGSDYEPGTDSFNRQPEWQFSQELQLQSSSSGRFKWTVGGFYYRANASFDPSIIDLTTAGLLVTIVGKQRTESIAGFVQGTYEISDNTNLTLGGRYTHETREAFGGNVVRQIAATGTVIATVSPPDIKKAANKFTFRLALDHRFSSEVLGYASFNRGFKSGGFNVNSPGTPAYEPETLDTYEVGLKTDLLDRRLRVNVAGFYNKYSDVQSQILNAVGQLTIVNAAKATTYGLDMDFQARLSDSLDLNGGLGLLHAEYDSYPGAQFSTPLGGTPVTVGDAKGNRIPLASPITATIGFDYHRPLGSGKISLSSNLYYNDGQFFEADNVIEQKAYAYLNSTLKWVSADEHFSLAVFGKNLTNQRVIGWVATTGNGTHVGHFRAPRTYGVTAGFKF